MYGESDKIEIWDWICILSTGFYLFCGNGAAWYLNVFIKNNPKNLLKKPSNKEN